MINCYKEYKTDLINAINSLDEKILDSIIRSIIETNQKNKTVFLIGNGGSSATPSHSAGDWSK